MKSLQVGIQKLNLILCTQELTKDYKSGYCEGANKDCLSLKCIIMLGIP